MPRPDPRTGLLLGEGVAEPAPEGWALVARLPRPGLHGFGCRCCGRDPVALFLNGLFQRQVRAGRPMPSRLLVVASPATVAAVMDAARHDPFVRARFPEGTIAAVDEVA
ncbi:hypothetical protein [Rhizosaccharibacter radicis]|uniref:Uncharacterized protein n=1 Tax=Rhizosaccharibacter radicis TaxID=2782605 RepID=A0ABT1VTH7_9PROT|nr:hypothetical protein [Acetobacteraceae bacterium KSS12]